MGLRCPKVLVVFPGLVVVLMRAQQPSGLKIFLQIQGSSVTLRGRGTCGDTVCRRLLRTSGGAENELGGWMEGKKAVNTLTEQTG